MTFLNTEDTYRMLQPFASKEELNANTKAIRHNFKEELYGTVREVLDVLHRYAVKFCGVCYLSKSEIAKMLEVSTRTIVRACNKLVALGVIQQYETKRHRGDRRQSTNAIVFVTQVNMRTFLDVIPECHTEKAPLDTPKLKDLKDNNTYATQPSTGDKDELLVVKEKTPYQKLREFIEYFSEDKKLAYKMYGIYIAQTKRQINKPEIDIAIEAVKHTFNALKRKAIHSITGYFNNTLKGLLDKFYEAEASECYESVEGDFEFVNGENLRGPEWLNW